MKNLYLLVVAFLFACSDHGQTIQGTRDLEGQEIIITVKFLDTQRQLDNAYIEVTKASSAQPDLDGFAAWAEIAEEGNIPWCEIYTLRPETDRDSKVRTLGHEVLHCLYGSFHQ